MNIDYKELLSLRYYKKLIPDEVYFTSKGIFRAISKNRYTEFIIRSNNLSGLTKDDVGLTNVDNTADIDKPLSNPVSAYLTSTYYPLSNPSGYVTSSSLSGYLTSAVAAATYYPLSNPSGYVDATALSGYLTTSAAATIYYPLTNPSGYISAITGSDITTALGYTPVNQSGDTMTGYLILNADPTNALGAVTKQYVDNITVGLNFHEPVHAATTGNLSATYLNGTGGVGATLTATSNGALIVDTHTLLLGDRLMVWQQSAGLENGIYDVTDTGSTTTPFILTRSADADNSPSGELAYGDFCFVQQGATYGGFGFIMNTTGTINIGTTSISYVQFNAAQAITAGYGLQELTPNVISVDTSIIATVTSLGLYLTTASAAATYQPIGSYLTTISGLNISLLTNDSGYVTSSALSGYLTSATAASTYYPLANPSGYITSSALSGYLTSATAATTYFPIPTGTTAEYIRGDGSLATFPTVPSFTPSPLTKSDDTNVTLTLGGNPSTALLEDVSLTLGWTGTLDDSRITSATTWNNKSRLQYNNSTGTQSITANTVTYLTGSAITTDNIQAGTVITWTISVRKTNAGTAAPAWTVRFGTNASTSDATLLSFTGAAQTAAVDTGIITIQCTFRTVGSGTSAVLVGHYSLVHQLDSTGLSTGNGGAFATSAGFDSTTANSFLGVTVNSGASAAWTVNQVNVKIENIV
jgi:hypothetical protein